MTVTEIKKANKAKMAISAHETIPIGNDYLLLDSDLKDFETFKIPNKNSLNILLSGTATQWDTSRMVGSVLSVPTCSNKFLVKLEPQVEML